MSTKTVLLSVGLTFLISTSSAFYIYLIGGVYKDFPAFGLYQADNSERGFNLFSSADNIHIHYNEVVRKLDKGFEDQGRTNILVIGNSFGRDVTNIILESPISENAQVSYFDISRIPKDPTIKDRWIKADYIFVGFKEFKDKAWVQNVGQMYDFEIDFEKVYCVGTKDFGNSNGIHYNRMGSISNLSQYYTHMKHGVSEIEEQLKNEWGDKYISLIDPVSNQVKKVRVFTEDGKFISQDTVHLTVYGAKYYAHLLRERLRSIFNA